MNHSGLFNHFFYKRNLAFLLFFVLTYSCNMFSQTDSITKRGTIKISKKVDSTYVKADMFFYKYSAENTNEQLKKITYQDIINDAKANTTRKPLLVAHPKIKEKSTAFNYTKYFSYNQHTRNVNLGENQTDTVRLIVHVTKKGEVRYVDLTPMQKQGKIVAVYDPVEKIYKVDLVHYKVFNAFNELIKTNWEPAYLIEPKKGELKKITVIKPHKTKVNASGLLTIIFSKSPFYEDEQ